MIESLITKFKLCVNRYELDELIKIFSQQDTYALLLGSSIELRKELANTIRSKIITLIFLEGDIADKKYREYLYLYGLFEGLDLDSEDLLDGYTSLISQHLQSNNFEIVEKFLLLEVRALAFMLQGQTKMAIRGYLEEAIKIDLHKLMGTGIIEFLRSFFHFFPIPIEEVLEAMRHNLEKNRYFSLDPIARRSIFCWALHFFWLNSRFFYNTQWSELYPLLKILFIEHFKRNELDEAMYLQFFMTVTNASFFQTQEQWKVYNQEIIKSAEPFYKEYAKTLPLCKEKIRPMGKKIIGILKERAVANSPYKVEWSLLKALMQDTQFTEAYDVKIYMMGYVEHGFDDLKIIKSYQDIGIEVVNVVKTILAKSIYYHSHLEKALAIRDRILKDEVDILIFTNDCYDIHDFLMVSRCAPRQIFWSHGNFEYDIEGIGKRISHFEKPSGCAYDFETFSVDIDIERFHNPYRDPDLIASERAKYPKEVSILGVIGRLLKVDSDEYLETVAKIMEKNLNTIFIAAGTGDQDSIRKKVQKFGISNRFYMSGFVDPHIYGHIVDLWLDTFPLSGGEALNEYMAKGGVPVIFLSKEHPMHARLEKTGVLKTLKRIHAFSVEDYISIASAILQDNEVCNLLKENMQTRNKYVEDQRKDVGKKVNDFTNILF